MDKPQSGRRGLRSREACFDEWLKLADEWRRLQSDEAYRRCLLARRVYYLRVLGTVPPLQEETTT